jgi:hypothetical protein
MFTVNYMLAKALQNDQLRMAKQDGLVRQFIANQRRKVAAKAKTKQTRS